MSGVRSPAGTLDGFVDRLFAETLARLDVLRRSFGGEGMVLAEMHVEAARGNLHHARDAVAWSLAEEGPWSLTLDGDGLDQSGEAGGRLSTRADRAREPVPSRPDLGADLMAAPELRRRAEDWVFAGLLASGLADHAWHHLESGCSWGTDHGGAAALVSAANGGRPFPLWSPRELRGTVDEEVARALASLGWRRLRSPTLTGA